MIDNLFDYSTIPYNPKRVILMRMESLAFEIIKFEREYKEKVSKKRPEIDYLDLICLSEKASSKKFKEKERNLLKEFFSTLHFN